MGKNKNKNKTNKEKYTGNIVVKIELKIYPKSCQKATKYYTCKRICWTSNFSSETMNATKTIKQYNKILEENNVGPGTAYLTKLSHRVRMK